MNAKCGRKFGFPDADCSGEGGRLVLETFEELGWERVYGPGWDLLWYVTRDPPPEAYHSLQPQQRLNHLPGIAALAAKPQLYSNLLALKQRMKGRVDDAELEFFPRTYLLPEQWPFLAVRAARQPQRRWLLKPAYGSWGRDIRIITDVAEVPRSGVWLAQEYLDNPLTHDGRKLNLRVFVLIRSVEPLEVYLCRDGYVDLASEPYSMEVGSLGDPYVHNTNSGVQLARPGVRAEDCWLDIGSWRDSLRGQGADDAALWRACQDIIVKTVISAHAALRAASAGVVPHPDNCFELLGLDLLIDHDLKPWLIECNRSPSMTTALSGDIKKALVRDTLELVGLGAGSTPAPGVGCGGYDCIYPGASADAYAAYFQSEEAV